MAGTRHRTNGIPPPVMPVSAVIVALLLGGGIVLGSFLALRADPGPGGACDGGIELRVAVAPRLAEAFAEIAESYQATAPEVDGRCVAVSLTNRATREVVADLATGWTEPSPDPAPDIWIPESATWLALARSSEAAAKLLPEAGTTIATSPVVIAMPRPMAEAVDWPRFQLGWAGLTANNGSPTTWSSRGHPEWGPFRVGLADPASSSASLSAVMNIVSTAHGVPVEEITAAAFRQTQPRTTILTFERTSEQVPPTAESLLTQLRDADRRGEALTFLSAFPASESDVIAYNRGRVAGALGGGDGNGGESGGGADDGGAGDGGESGGGGGESGGGGGGVPQVPLAAFYPPDGLTVEQVPFVLLRAAAEDPSRSPAAASFLDALRGETGQGVLTAAGLRTPDGKNPALTDDDGVLTELPGRPQPPADGAALAAAADTFRGIHRRGATLAVFDTSGSMAQAVPDSGGKTRMQVAVDAVLGALPLVADQSELGLWHFSTNLDDNRDYKELVPIGPMTERIEGVPRREYFATMARTLTPGGETGLYDSALAAFRKLSAEYVPDKANQIVLISDGVNEDPGSISLDDLVATLEQEFDPQRPVGVITIAYGAEADQAALERISSATGVKSYQSLDPNSISELILEALLDR